MNETDTRPGNQYRSEDNLSITQSGSIVKCLDYQKSILVVLILTGLVLGTAAVITAITLHPGNERRVILEQNPVGPDLGTLNSECQNLTLHGYSLYLLFHYYNRNGIYCQISV